MATQKVSEDEKDSLYSLFSNIYINTDNKEVCKLEKVISSATIKGSITFTKAMNILKHGGYMVDTWWIHGGYMVDTWLLMKLKITLIRKLHFCKGNVVEQCSSFLNKYI